MDIDEKIKLIKEVGQEIVTEDELRELLEKKKDIIAYDGFEPSGKIHIAQGLLRAINVNKLTKTGIRFKFYVADWFALLNNKMGGDLKKIKIVGKYFIEVWKACGMDLSKVEFIWASDFIRENEDYWECVLKLSMNATIQRVLRCGQIMGREESTSNPSAQILYPLMQAADMITLKVDIAQLGIDQRKVNMLARDVFPKLGHKKPIVISHHMLMGLSEPKKSNSNSIERKIEIKMSKSKPDTAIFMDDTEEDIKRKINKAYCPLENIEENPILEYCKYIIFEKFDKFIIKRPEKFGGDLEITSYDELVNIYKKKELHPMDLKNSVSGYINDLIKPVREHFNNDANAKALLKQVKSFEATR